MTYINKIYDSNKTKVLEIVQSPVPDIAFMKNVVPGHTLFFQVFLDPQNVQKIYLLSRFMF